MRTGATYGLGLLAATGGVLCLVPAAGSAADLPAGVTVYGSLRSHLAVFDGDAEIQNNSSRIGLRLNRPVGSDWSMIARVEWGVNLVDNQASFNVDANSGSEFATITPVAGDAFVTRLGNLGLSHDTYGTLRIGKQWGVYYDVAGLTDRFFVFGAEASGAFNANTDGGLTGVGRAEKAAVYRGGVGGLTAGLQAQISGDGDGDEIDSYGTSVLYDHRSGLSLGVAYNAAKLDPDLIPFTGEENGTALTACLSYERGTVAAALLCSRQESQDGVDIGDEGGILVYDADGVELYAHVDLTERLRIHAGGNYLDPQSLLQNGAPVAGGEIDGDFRIRYAVLGGSYSLDSAAWVYVEAKIDGSVGPLGEDSESVVTFGLKYDFKD